MELNLVEHLDVRFHGLAPPKYREFAFEYANGNPTEVPESWKRNKQQVKIATLVF